MCELSIVIPVFNHPDTTKVMIDSLLSNTYKEFEVIVVDDGSDTETLNLLQSYQESDPRVKVLHRQPCEPKGPQTCRNKGLDYAQGQFIIFFDSDDLVTSTCLENRVNSIKSRPELDFLVFPSGILTDGRLDPTPHEMVFGHKLYDDDIEMFARRILPFIVWNNIYRRENLVRSGIRWDVNLKSLQDADFNLQTLLSGMKYDYAHVDPDYAYRTAAKTASVSSRIITDSHKNSHIYATDKFFSTIISKFGHKYDKAITDGAMKIFYTAIRSKMDSQFAADMANCIRKYNKHKGLSFIIKVKFCQALNYLISYKRARQIAFLPFLIRSSSANKRKLKGLEEKTRVTHVKAFNNNCNI